MRQFICRTFFPPRPRLTSLFNSLFCFFQGRIPLRQILPAGLQVCRPSMSEAPNLSQQARFVPHRHYKKCAQTLQLHIRWNVTQFSIDCCTFLVRANVISQCLNNNALPCISVDIAFRVFQTVVRA